MSQTEIPDPVTAGRALYDQLIDAWNRRDAGAFAQCFAADGSMVGFDGTQMDGGQNIVKHIGGVFAHHQTARFVTIVREVRPVGADAVLVRANAGMVPPGKNDINPATNAAQSMIAVRSGARWKVAMFQNTPSALHGRPEDAERLTQELRDAIKR